jgi:1,4-alpha-glucan branching enzyme
MSKAGKAARAELGKAVRFLCVAPEAKSVFLAGTFNQWDATATPMLSEQTGEWHVAIDLLPGTYEYKYVVDGVWCCEAGVADEDYVGGDAVVNPFGTKNRIMEVK